MKFQRRILLLVGIIVTLASCEEQHKPADQADLKEAAIKEMKSTLEFLADDKLEGRETGTENEIVAAEYLANKFEEIGLLPKGTEGYYQKFTFKPMVAAQMHQTGDSTSLGMGLVKEIEGRNVVGYIDNGKDQTIVIGAHYDHLGYGGQGSLHSGEKAIHNGADDNASGVSSMLYLANQLKSQYSNNNYLFIAFSGEEKGIYGSSYFVKNSTIDTESINYMLNMDMVGRLKEENVLAIYGVGTSPIWESTLEQIDIDSITLAVDESGVGPSDHTSFYLADIPVLHFFTGQHEDYHKPSDDADKINYDGIYSVSNYILEVIKMLDDDEEPLEFTKTKDTSDSKSKNFNVTMGIIPDYLYTDGGMRLDGTKDDRPGANAGLMKGDIILWVDEIEVNDMNDYMTVLGMYEPGQTCIVKYDRDGEVMETELTW